MQTLRQKKSYNSLNSHYSPFFFRQRGLFHFSFLSHICGSFPRLVPFFSFPPPCSLFPLLLLQANSICRSSLSLASGSDPDKNTLKLTFPLPKSHNSDFFKPQNLHISKKMRTFAPDFRTTSHPLTLSSSNPFQGLCPRPDTEWIETGKEVS